MAAVSAGVTIGNDVSDEGPAPGLPTPTAALLRREEWRGILALSLFILLSVLLLSLAWAGILELISPDDANSLAQTLGTPLFTLVGSVVGFYFGKQQGE